MSFYFVLAIANNRVLSVTDTEVRFRYKDYARGSRRKVMTLVPRSSFAASCCMCCRQGLCVFAITGCWPIVPRA